MREPESFRSLLLRHRGRTRLAQRDLAERAGVSRRSMQDWEAGVTLPTAERLRALLRALLDLRALTPGQELSEARELWTAVEREGPRMHTPFDDAWFARLLAMRAVSVSEPADHTALDADDDTRGAARAQDWGDAPDAAGFVGRADELALLRGWVLDKRCRIVAVLGIGGIGKTSLAAKLAQILAPGFERVYWRSLRNAPPVSEWLAGAIGFLSDQRQASLSTESEQITALLQLLRGRRCLLILDNSETLFEPGQQESRYRTDMDGYGRLIRAIGEASHQGCLVLTSREAPPELALLTGVRELEVRGLGIDETRALLAEKHLRADSQVWSSLVGRYGGNGLALKIVGETIRQVYAGDVAAFLAEALTTSGAVFGGIRRLLDIQAERLSPVERDILTRLAVEREPVTLAELLNDMAPHVPRHTVIEAIETLRRRSLVERGERGATHAPQAPRGTAFTLQSMVLEYVTDRLVETVVDEIERVQPRVIIELPLIKAQAKEYVRQAQERLIAAPVVQSVEAQHGKGEAERRLLALMEPWRGRPAAEQMFGPGNVVNLLRLLRGDLRAVDLSNLAIRQAYLALVEMQASSLAGASLAESMLAEAFSDPLSIAMSADGELLAAGSITGEVWLWRLADRLPLLALPAHTGVIWSVALSADGQLLASGGDDGTLRVWATNTGQPLATLHAHTGGVWGVAMSADGRLIATGGADGMVQLWESSTGRRLQKLQGHAGTVWRVALSADGSLVASGGADGTVRLWETSSGRSLATLHGHSGLVASVALCADGHVAASGGDDRTVRVWDTTHGRQLATLQGHTGTIWRVALSTDGATVASASADGSVRLWATATGRLVMTLQGHTNEVTGVAISRDGQLIASSGGDSAVRLWDATTGRQLAALHGKPVVVSDVALSADARLLATKDSRGPRLWETATGRALPTLHGRTDGVWRVALSANGQLLAGGFGDGTLSLWETSSGRQLATTSGHTGGIWGLALSANGRVMASGGADGTVRVWETDTARALAVLEGHDGIVWRVALSADGHLVASAGGDGTVRLWEASTGRSLAILHGHTGGVLSVALSADGDVLASSGDGGTVRLWQSSSGLLLATLEGGAGLGMHVLLSADGTVVASGGSDGMVRLWDAHAKHLLRTIKAHTGRVQGLALSADGQVLVSGGSDGIVNVWEAQSGACLRSLRAEPRYDRLDITGLSGVTEAQRVALFALGAVEASA